MKSDEAGETWMSSTSWVPAANHPESDFPIQNLPYGVFRGHDHDRIGVAIGDRILDLCACAEEGLLTELSDSIVSSCRADRLNPFMSLGPAAWSALRSRLTSLLQEQAEGHTRERVEPFLVPMQDAVMRLPAHIGDYTDFYASIHHARRVGKLFRPDNPLLPNYKYIPIGYHGRASSIVTSGTEVRRPCGQTRSDGAEPLYSLTQSLDYELEVGIFIGAGNPLGQRIPIAEAEEHIFGLCLLNDWSARDMQSWEYQPLGPFLAKSFATTISPWIVPLEALSPFRVPAFERPQPDPSPLHYLTLPSSDRAGIDLTLEVYLQSALMRQMDAAPLKLSTGNLRDLYWSLTQLVTHHASNGCNLRPGDLIATGTISGSEEGSEGCLLEKQHNPKPVCLPTGELRGFLQDGDQVTFRACCKTAGLPRIGFGECTGTIVGASDELCGGKQAFSS
jgi:fumarylacetoacetase